MGPVVTLLTENLNQSKQGGTGSPVCFCALHTQPIQVLALQNIRHEEST